MVFLRRPGSRTIQNFLAFQSRLGFSYTAVGATSTGPPAGYVVDHTRVGLGRGEQVFARAKGALERWGQFDLGWVEVWPPGTPLRDGEVVAVMSRQFGLWWLSACRIVSVVIEEEQEPVARFGFAYGTLPDHAGTGEERFLIEWDRHSDEVCYDILAFSRPRWLVARLGYPYMRRLQKRFGRESAAAMLRAVDPRV
jgi:uncharacterized protein (UPF0548 family)